MMHALRDAVDQVIGMRESSYLNDDKTRANSYAADERASALQRMSFKVRGRDVFEDV